MNVRMEMDIEYLIRIVNNDMNIKKRFAKNAQLAQSAMGCVPNEPVQKLAQVRICTLLAK